MFAAPAQEFLPSWNTSKRVQERVEIPLHCSLYTVHSKYTVCGEHICRLLHLLYTYSSHMNLRELTGRPSLINQHITVSLTLPAC